VADILVVLRGGVSEERSWLGLRAALAFSLGGHDLQVALQDAAVGLALPGHARSWLEGDPGAELRGLVDEFGVRVLVDADALVAAGAAATDLASGCVTADSDMYAEAVAAAAMVVAF